MRYLYPYLRAVKDYPHWRKKLSPLSLPFPPKNLSHYLNQWLRLALQLPLKDLRLAPQQTKHQLWVLCLASRKDQLLQLPQPLTVKICLTTLCQSQRVFLLANLGYLVQVHIPLQLEEVYLWVGRRLPPVLKLLLEDLSLAPFKSKQHLQYLCLVIYNNRN